MKGSHLYNSHLLLGRDTAFGDSIALEGGCEGRILLTRITPEKSGRDERWRPVESGTFPLAYGVTNRMGKLRAYGNAINAQQAQIFIESYLSAQN